ncbi:MAG: L-lactate permease [Actinobacteria bacterium]|nr:MAG: L-lactate permease [Actinomycetota bacterium]
MPGDLPITLTFWLLALLPLVTLLVLLVWLRWTAAQAGSIGFFVAAALAWLVFRSGFSVLSVAVAKGIWDAIFILYVVWPALLLYQITDVAGAFDVFRKGIQRYTKSRLILVLAFGWVFASFLQGIAGFGTPIAIVAPLLVGIGVTPIMAVIIPLIGHAWANMFGTLAVGWLATIQVIDLRDPGSTAFQTAILLWIVDLMGGLTIAWIYGRGKAVVRALPVVLAVSVVHGGGQLLLSTVNPIISNFVPATLALGVILGMERLPMYRGAEPIETDIFKEPSGEAETEEEELPMSMNTAMAPYYVLIVISILALVIPPVTDFLERFEVGLPFPAVQTGFGVQRAAEEMYGEFALFTHPGTFLLISALVGYAVFKSRDLYTGEAGRQIMSGTVENAVPASIAILGFLTLSKLMDHSGMTTVLALGIAEVSPPLLYAFLSNFIGVLGAFMTSSNTASNILFAPLQQQAAQATVLTEPSIIGAQSTGGAIGNAIAPANVVLGTGTAKIIGREGDVLKYTLPWSLLVAVLVGAATIGLYVFTV